MVPTPVQDSDGYSGNRGGGLSHSEELPVADTHGMGRNWPGQIEVAAESIPGIWMYPRVKFPGLVCESTVGRARSIGGSAFLLLLILVSKPEGLALVRKARRRGGVPR